MKEIITETLKMINEKGVNMKKRYWLAISLFVLAALVITNNPNAINNMLNRSAPCSVKTEIVLKGDKEESRTEVTVCNVISKKI
jgi:hypothetical protein